MLLLQNQINQKYETNLSFNLENVRLLDILHLTSANNFRESLSKAIILNFLSKFTTLYHLS